MREIPGSIPEFSKEHFSLVITLRGFFIFSVSIVFFPPFLIFCDKPTVEIQVDCPNVFRKKHSIAALLFTETKSKVVPRYITDLMTLLN